MVVVLVVWVVVLVVGTAQNVSKKSNIENAMSLQSRVLVSESSHIQNKSHSYNYSLSQPSLSIRRLFFFFFFPPLVLLPPPPSPSRPPAFSLSFSFSCSLRLRDGN